jgi:hypothetical protein
MQAMILFLQAIFVLGVVVLSILVKQVLPSYLSEKGKNIATKQDIAEIMHESEKGKNLATKQDIAAITREVELAKVAFLEHQTRFSLFQQKQSEVIGETYSLLHDARVAIAVMVNPVQIGGDGAEEERRTKAIESFNTLSNYYHKRKIYLPDTIVARMEEVLGRMKRAANDYLISRESQGGHTTLLWKGAYDTMETELPPLFDELQRTFKELVNSVPVVINQQITT